MFSHGKLVGDIFLKCDWTTRLSLFIHPKEESSKVKLSKRCD